MLGNNFTDKKKKYQLRELPDEQIQWLIKVSFWPFSLGLAEVFSAMYKKEAKITKSSFAFQTIQYLLGRCGLPLYCSEPDAGQPQQSKWAVGGRFPGLENVHWDAMALTDQEEEILRAK